MKVWSILNQKGGVMKSTLVLLLSQALANRGFKVLAVDLDAQRNLSLYAGLYDQKDNIFTVLKGDTKDVHDAISSAGTFDILIGSTEMKNWNSTAKELKSSENRLQRALRAVNDEYDYVIIDNPPALDEATINSMVAATGIIIPTEAKIGSVAGILEMQEDIEEVKDLFDKPDLQILGIIPTKVERGSFGVPKKTTAREHISALDEVAEELGTKVFNMYISNNKEYEELAETHVNYWETTKASTPKKEIDKFVDMLLKEK